MNGFLKNLGKILKTAATIGLKIASYEPLVQEYGALVRPLLPAKAQQIEQTVLSDFDTVSTLITGAEASVTAAMGAAVTGPQKLAAATQAVGTVVNNWLDSRGLKVAEQDAQRFEAIVESFASGWADLLNLAQKK